MKLMPLLFLLLNACASTDTQVEQTSRVQQRASQSNANADSYVPAVGQCVALTKEKIDLIKSLQLQGRRYLHYCHSCGDKKPAGPYPINTVTYAQTNQSYWNLKFNSGLALDAADTFVESKSNTFLNLSKLINCPAKNIKSEIEIPKRR